MRLRSMLFVPADSERKLARAASVGADAIILDLEDSVADSRKPEARKMAASMLDAAGASASAMFVRVNPLQGGMTVEDLCAVVRPNLSGIMLPKAEGGQDVTRLGHYLDALEARAGMAAGCIKIVVVATETAGAMFALGSYAPAHARLAGLTWGAEDLAASVGATSNKEDDGNWTPPYRMARTVCLFAAAAAAVAPIETLYSDYKDLSGLQADCRRARRDGFTGRLAIHPDQVALINSSFTPSDAEIAEARRIVAAFANAPGLGVVGIDGKMYDLPHLKAAQRTLASVEDAG
jgi:citrate lyase subunit beta/citryl-CoA lyase